MRAANEVMQVTGVVEDTLAAREKAAQYIAEKNNETSIGLRMMDACRMTFIGGTWGVIGLRRRILVSTFLEVLCIAYECSSINHMQS